MTIKRLTGLVALLWLPLGLAIAEPLALEQADQDLPEVVMPDPGDGPGEVQAWVQRETMASLLNGTSDGDRELLLRQTWQPPAPTWIQSGATVNLGDFPSLDDPTATAERDLQTLQWVLEEQRRLAAGKPSQRAGDDTAAPEDNWIRRLMPRQLIATLKANREWVAAGGTALLVIVWAGAAFSRRPDAPPSIQPASPAPARRRRRHREPSAAGPRHVATQEMRRTRL